MKLLFITQKVDVDDDVLGFVTKWIAELSKYYEKVSVICLYEGKYNLPKNVQVYSLGKESNTSRILYILKFYKYIFKLRKDYTNVFVHMNQIYVILGGLFWTMSKKKIALWYAHGTVSISLRLATFITHIVLTSTESGFRIETPKKKVIGQGIDTENVFVCPTQFEIKKKINSSSIYTITTVGRISGIKGYDQVVDVAKLLVTDNIKFRIELIGSPVYRHDFEYKKKLHQKIIHKNLDTIFTFVGSVENSLLPKYLCRSDLFVNMSSTGSLDKVILEAMACDTLVLTCNEALKNILPEECLYVAGDIGNFHKKIIYLYSLSENEKSILQKKLRNIVCENHSLQQFAKKIIYSYE